MRSGKRFSWSTYVAVVLLFIMGAVQCWAQLDTGSISGIVQDKTGAVIAGATIKITNTKTGRTWDAKTGGNGEYNVPGLPVGPYRVEVAQQGFKTGTVDNIELHVSGRPRADVTLDIGAGGEVVTVSAETQAVNTSTSDLGATINATSVTNLPLNGRDFTSLIALVPGSIQTGQFGQNSLGGFETSLAGVNVLLDGSDATRIDVNATSTQLGRQESRISRASVDSIQEFRVLSGVYSAEYGRSSGDVVNVITKSGGNTVHGSLFEYFRNDVLDAKNYFATEKTPLRLNQFGGNLSGPIAKDKLFYFVNYEGVRQSITTPTDAIAVINAAARANFAPSMYPVRDAIPLPNVPGPVIFEQDGVQIVRNDLGWYKGALRNTLREDTGSVKVDWVASANDSFAFRYNIADSFTSTQYGIAAGQVSPSDSRNHLGKVTWNHNFTPTLLNEFGIAVNRPETNSLVGSDLFPIFQCSSFWGCDLSNNLGATPGPALFANRRPQYSVQFMDTLSMVKGRQTIRAGFDIRRNVTNDAADPQYFVSYANINDFYANSWIQISTLGHTMVRLSNTNYGFFVQDDIRVTPRLTVNLGLRYDYNSVLQGDEIGNFDVETLSLLPKGEPLYEPDRNNFAPRVGFSWDMFGTGKTVLRGGAGLFYNPLLTGAALSLAGNYQQNFNLGLFDLFFGRTCTPAVAVTFPMPATPPVCTPEAPANVNALDRNIRDTYSGHWSFGIQQEFFSNTVVEINYVGNRGIKLPAGAAYAGLELNYTPAGDKLLGDEFGNVRRLGNFLSSNYNALQVSVRRHIGRGLNLDANYTWAHQLDNAVNLMGGAYQDSHNPNGDYASGDIDVRHNLTMGVVYDVPAPAFLPKRLGEGWQITSLLQTRTGLPVNIALSAPFLGIDQVRPNFAPGATPDPSSFNKSDFVTPPAGQLGNVPRNFGRGPGFFQADLGLGKTTKINDRLALQFRGEMFNLFNHPNFANPSGNLDDQNFGRSTSTISNHVGSGTSRQSQLSLKLLF
ncbi:MAG TPA: TonB-dependent receptor [Clostridia bacterium]|nr:TonB-dependent receptor [Clostridia bacterium]